jgi:tetratricopeptide (TPR) repeat protein
MLCDPGAIFFSEKVYDDIRNKSDISVGYIGEKHLKNIAQPVKIYHISAPSLILPEGSARDKELMPASPRGLLRKEHAGLGLKQLLIVVTIILVGIAAIFLARTFWPGTGREQPYVPIAVISFENQTGDKNLDYLQKAIPNLIITNLEQSGLFQTMTWERMQDVMEQSGNKNVNFIDANMGFDICRKESFPFIVLGSFVKAGDVFMTDVKVLDVQSKKIITSFTTRGNGLSSILDSQIDELSKDISRSVGISNRKVETATMRILDVSTNSLGAYDYFLKGREAYDKMYFDDARQFLEKAVKTDPGFSIAHLYLSHAYSSLGIREKQTEELEKAYRTSDRATENEKLTIRAAYAGIIQNDPQQQLSLLLQLAVKAPKEKRVFFSLGLWYRDNGHQKEATDQFLKAVELDPNYGEAINQLAYLYFNAGDFTKALEYLKKYASIYPNDANPFDSMGDLFWRMGKLDEALENYKHALELKPGFYMSATKIAYIYGMKEDYPQVKLWMGKTLEAAPNENIRRLMSWCDAFVDYYYGKLEQSRQTQDELAAYAEKNADQTLKMGIHWLKSFISFDLGNYATALSENSSYLFDAYNEPSFGPKADSSGYYFVKGICHIKLNQMDSARIDLEMTRTLSADVKTDFNYNYLLKEITIASAKSSQLDSISPFKLQLLPVYSFPGILIYNVPFMNNSLAEAYIRAGRTDKAIAEYKRLLTFDPSTPDRRLINPRYHYYLGILYQDKGMKTEAAAQFRKFLELWKDADPSLKEVQEAEKRLEMLSD